MRMETVRSDITKFEHSAALSLNDILGTVQDLSDDIRRECGHAIEDCQPEDLSELTSKLIWLCNLSAKIADRHADALSGEGRWGRLQNKLSALQEQAGAYQQTELTAEISVLEKAIKSYEKHEKDADRFIALIDKYENFDKLTIAMLNEFIEKILVHERDRKGSIQTTQEVEIYFNFVGRFVPPAFGEVELTPEELEEIRKREERKDRLHQNYLKRKANGKQKEYEERTKAKKKAEIEARKQAIRTEDIARGVFIPVSSLPQLGPRKGA